MFSGAYLHTFFNDYFALCKSSVRHECWDPLLLQKFKGGDLCFTSRKDLYSDMMKQYLLSLIAVNSILTGDLYVNHQYFILVTLTVIFVHNFLNTWFCDTNKCYIVIIKYQNAFTVVG